MKQTAFFSLLLPIAFFAFTGCNDDSDIRIGGDFLSTIVEKSENRYLIELDGGVMYYTSSTVNQSTKEYAVGDRLYFRYFQINYDEQPAGADGSKTAPFEMSYVSYELMPPCEQVDPSSEVEALASDPIDFLYAPYVESTTIGNCYLNLKCILPSGCDPKINLIYRRTNSDTIFYDLKTTFQKHENYYQTNMFVETIRLKNLQEKGLIHLSFRADEIDYVDGIFKSDSTCVIPYEVTPVKD